MSKTLFTFCLFGLLSFLSSCTNEFEPIDYGHDACAYCKMTIMDNHFAAELRTKKGKAYKFDDISCLRKYIKQENMDEAGLTVFVADYNNPAGNFLDARRAVYLHSEKFRSAMNGGFAAFAGAESAIPLKDSLHTGLLKWENLN